MTTARHDHVEERLRAALDARARLVGPDRLRPSAPPAAPPAAPAAAWRRIRRGAPALLALAAVVAGVVLWLDSRHQDAPAPPARMPATSPSVTGPPTPAPALSAVPLSPRAAVQSPR
ncbi:hypothetical protein [Streptomyces sp. NPDC056160]|uniref:hypothetical protein n=1 Tax=Streptomyces sp. NPDC056160 TaxID=3345731 RepID=UPI0035D85C8A